MKGVMRVVFRAVKEGWRAYVRRPADTLQYMVLTLVIHMMAAAPLLAVLDLALWPVLLVSPALFVLLVLPMRQNAAEVMQQALKGGRLFDIGLVSFRGYGRKVGAGFRQTLLLMLWMLPLLVVAGGALWIYKLEGVAGSTDAFTLLRYVRSLGGGELWVGALMLVLIFAALWVPLMVGCAFHSGTRHARALGDPRLMRGHQGGQMLTWLAAECTLPPYLAALGMIVAGYVPQVMNAVNRYEFSGLMPGKGMLIGLAAATVLLLIPALPLRDLIIAAYPACIHNETEADK